jgi:hypothetical protein
MDGFYVARIQKLSDKIKGQNDSTDTAETHPGENEEPEVNDKAKEPNTKTIKGKKRKGAQQEEEVSRMAEKKGKLSVPPSKDPQDKSKKNRVNAKTTKPRRKKADA